MSAIRIKKKDCSDDGNGDNDNNSTEDDGDIKN